MTSVHLHKFAYLCLAAIWSGLYVPDVIKWIYDLEAVGQICLDVFGSSPEQLVCFECNKMDI